MFILRMLQEKHIQKEYETLSYFWGFGEGIWSSTKEGDRVSFKEKGDTGKNGIGLGSYMAL